MYVFVAVYTVHNNFGTSSLVVGLVGLHEDSLITLRIPTSVRFFGFVIDGSGGSVISPFLLFVNLPLQTRDFRDTLVDEIAGIAYDTHRLRCGFAGTDGRDRLMDMLIPPATHSLSTISCSSFF